MEMGAPWRGLSSALLLFFLLNAGPGKVAVSAEENSVSRLSLTVQNILVYTLYVKLTSTEIKLLSASLPMTHAHTTPQARGV